MKIFTFIFIILCTFSLQTYAKVVANLSTEMIAIGYNFKGKFITISGVTDRDEDLIITVKGPNRSYRIWKKEKVDGVWINSKSLTVNNAHSYFFIASTEDLKTTRPYLKKLNLSYQDHDIILSEHHINQYNDFLHQFKSFRQSELIYSYDLQRVEMVSSNIFKTEFFVPQSALVGVYDIDIFTFIDGKYHQKLTLNFTVNKQGIYAKIDDLSKNHPLIYSILSVIIALIIGAFAGFIFRKDR